MDAERLSSSLAFALAVALVYYILSMETVLALLLAVTAHELAHVIVLRMVGLRVKRLRLELTGLCIDYCGYACPAGHAAAALAGPAGGLAYAYFASLLARRLSCGWLEVSSGLSLLLSLFNMLPVIPLDGGRIAVQLLQKLLGERSGNRAAGFLGLAVSLLLSAAGLLLALQGKGTGLLIAGGWLLLSQNAGQGIVKKRELL